MSFPRSLSISAIAAFLAAFLLVAGAIWWLGGSASPTDKAPDSGTHSRRSRDAASESAPEHAATAVSVSRPDLGIVFAECAEPEQPLVCQNRQAFRRTLDTYFQTYQLSAEQRAGVLNALAVAQGQLMLLLDLETIPVLAGRAPTNDESNYIAAQQQIVADAVLEIRALSTPVQWQGWTSTFSNTSLLVHLSMDPFEVPWLASLQEAIRFYYLPGAR